MITFREHSSKAYPPRTYENASADITIAFAVDFNTSGEKLTKDAVIKQSKIYFPVVVENNLIINKARVKQLVWLLSENNLKSINIAGNGIYTFYKLKGYTQIDVDDYIYRFVESIFNDASFNCNIQLIRSGGQSGADEAGIKASEKIGIPFSLIVCPKGFKFIDINYNTICDERKFKQRFGY